METPPNAPKSVAYALVDVTPHWQIRPSRGLSVPPDWPERYLDHLREHGKVWLACKHAGISARSVERLRDADPRFVAAEQAARAEFTESLEQHLDNIAATEDGMPAVTAAIVRLKKLDPAGYVEKNLSVTLTATTQLDPALGHALLRDILGAGQGTTGTTELTDAVNDAVRVLPGSPSGEVTRALGEAGGPRDGYPSA